VALNTITLTHYLNPFTIKESYKAKIKYKNTQPKIEEKQGKTD